MPRKRKPRKNAAERRQEDIQRRIEKSEKNRSGKAAGRSPDVHDGQSAPQADAAPDKTPQAAPKKQDRRHREIREKRRTPIQTLAIRGDGERRSVAFPHGMTAGALLKAIRDGAYMSAGTVYIAAGHEMTAESDADMAYTFHGGLFVRQDRPDKKDRSARFLADVIDTPVVSAIVEGDASDMSWFVSLRTNT